jgi:hypothetical protein
VDQIVTLLPRPVTHICPITKIEIIGECPTIRCPARLPQGRHPSGCYYRLMGTEIDLPGLSFAFAISRRRARKELINGFAELQRLAILYEWLTLLRGEYDKFCSRCELPGSNCVNIKHCDDRIKLANIIKTIYPFNIVEFKFTSKDLWQLLLNQDNFAKQYSFEYVFGFTSNQIATLHRVRMQR